MTLVDTSVWVEYFRGTSRAGDLGALLDDDDVLLHPWVLGELALGNLGARRAAVIADLRRLPVAPVVPDEEVLGFIEVRGLTGPGIGWVDAHLLASSKVAECRIWTFDRALGAAAESLGVPADPG